MLENALACLENGRFRQAEAICREALAVAEGNEGALVLLAMSVQAQGRVTEALPLFAELTRTSPASYEHWNNYATALREVGRYPEASRGYLRALEIAGEHPGVLLNLGLNSLDSMDAIAARGFLEQAYALAPADVEIRVYCASAIYDCGDTRKARELISNWREWEAADPAVLAEAAWLLFRSGSSKDGLELLEITSRQHPGNVRLQVRQAAMYERSNRLDDAQVLVDALSRRRDLPPALVEDLALVRAALAARATDLGAARSMHEDLLRDNVTSPHNTPLYFSLAKICDRQDDASAAMDALGHAHRLQIESAAKIWPKNFSGDESPLTITRHRVSAEQARSWPADPGAPDALQSPIFVVGFPRSGTTMLETMLDAHPGLSSMDERPFLQDLVDHMRELGLSYPEQLGELTAAQLDGMRQRYWSLTSNWVKLDDNTRLVDKNPLNLLRLPMIRRVFPNAPIVLTLRDPADVVLSNYMQSFRSPAFIAMCANLASTARGYASAMDFWLDQSVALQAQFLTLRYEDLVDDLPAQARRLTDYLGLPWDDAMLRFHEHARERGYISTPSYSQVVQPVYSRSIGRWRMYAPYFAPITPVLAPYSHRWGYATS